MRQIQLAGRPIGFPGQIGGLRAINIQPSRGLGDAYLKYSEFRGPTPSALRPYVRSDPARSRRVRAPFAPPYILTEPEVKSMVVGERDDWLILASDGLWDEITPQEAVDLCEDFARRKRVTASMSHGVEDTGDVAGLVEHRGSAAEGTAGCAPEVCGELVARG